MRKMMMAAMVIAMAILLAFPVAAQEAKKDFPAELVGRWTYKLAGNTVTYIFTADGKMTAEANGEKSPNPPSDVTVVGNTLHIAHPNGLSGTGQYRIQKGVLTFSKITGQPGFSTAGKFKKE